MLLLDSEALITRRKRAIAFDAGFAIQPRSAARSSTNRRD